MCLFFPARCLTCGKAVRAQRLVCRACAASLPQKPFFQEFPLPRAQEGRLEVVAPLSYEKGTRRTLRRLKFQEERALAKPLAALMAQAVGQWGREFDGVVWVPMSPKKLQQRGYNQSQLLAKALAKELGLPWWTLLEQARETATQHNLTRAQRADNVRGAYRARAEAAGQRLLLGRGELSHTGKYSANSIGVSSRPFVYQKIAVCFTSRCRRLFPRCG